MSFDHTIDKENTLHLPSAVSKLKSYYTSKQKELDLIIDNEEINNIFANNISTYTPKTDNNNDVYERTDFKQLLNQITTKLDPIYLEHLKVNIDLINPSSESFCSKPTEFSIFYTNKELTNELLETLYSIYEILVKNTFFEKFKTCNDYQSLSTLINSFEKPFKNHDIPIIYKPKFDKLLETLKKYSFEKNIEFRNSFKFSLEYCFQNKLHSSFIELYNWSKELLDYENIMFDLFCNNIMKIFNNNFENDSLFKTVQIYDKNIEILIFDHLLIDLKYYENFMLNDENKKPFYDKIKKFITLQKLKQRCQKSYEICIEDVPDQEQVLIELKHFFEQNNEYVDLFTNSLQEAVNKKINQGTILKNNHFNKKDSLIKISTEELIFMYTKLLKAMKILGPISNSMKHLIFPIVIEKIKQQNDASSVLCLAIFDSKTAIYLNDVTILGKKYQFDMNIVSGIKKEFENNHISTVDYDMNQQITKSSFDTWFDKNFLNWKPEPIKEKFKSTTNNINNYNDFLNIVAKVSTHDKFKDQEKSTLHYLVMTLFPQNKEVLLNEFVKISKHLFLSPFFTSDDFTRWQDAMKSILSIVSNEDLSATDNDSPVTSLLQNLQIMVNDYHALYIHNESTFLGLSSNYWNIEEELDYSMVANIFKNSNFAKICGEIELLYKKYASDNIGQKVNILYDKSCIEVNLTFADGRVVHEKVPFLSGILIYYLAENDVKETFDISLLKNIVPFNSLDGKILEKALDFWIEKLVLSKNDNTSDYKIIENLNAHLATLELQKSFQINEKIKHVKAIKTDHNIVEKDINYLLNKNNFEIEIHNYLEPFIKGLIMNQKKALSFNNIQSWLNLSVPSNNRNSLTSSQLETYLNLLVEANVLVKTSNDCYRLAPKK